MATETTQTTSAASVAATPAAVPSPIPFAIAKAQNLPVSTKQAVEICRELRWKTTTAARKYLQEVLQFHRAVPYKRHIFDLGHKPGIGPGRYPQKTTKAILQLLKAVEANAQVKGLNVSSLKITKLLADKAAKRISGGRQRHFRRNTHLEIEVREVPEVKKEEKKGEAKKGEAKRSNVERGEKTKGK